MTKSTYSRQMRCILKYLFFFFSKAIESHYFITGIFVPDNCDVLDVFIVIHIGKVVSIYCMPVLMVVV